MSEVPVNGPVNGEMLCQETDPVSLYLDYVIEYVKITMPRELSKIINEVSRSYYREGYEEVANVFDQIKAKYDELSRPVNLPCSSEDIYESLREDFSESYRRLCEEFISSLNTIFPAKLAKVNLPEYCQVDDINITGIEEWQRKNKLDPETADREYMRFMAETKEGVVEDFAAEESSTFPEDFEVDESEVSLGRGNGKILHRLLEKFIDRKSNEKGTISFINYKKDLKEAKNILDFLNKIKVPGGEELAAKYIKEITRKNHSEVLSVARLMVEEKASRILEDRLDLFATKLDTYIVAPGMAVDGLSGVAKKNSRSETINSEIDNRSSQLMEIGMKAGDLIILDSETFPWFEEDSTVEVLHIEAGNGSAVAVIDARTEAAKKVEHKMSGYETKKKRQAILPIILNKLNMVARCVAYSKDHSVNLPVGVDNRLKEVYPFTIYAWKPQSANAKRVYVSKMGVASLPDESDAKISLQKSNITEVILYLGACDKNRQDHLLPIFTGEDSTDAARHGAGV